MSRAAMQSEPSPRPLALLFASARRSFLPVLATAAVLAAPAQAVAQASRPTAAASAPTREEGVRWHTLTPAQREALAPLERDWPTIEAPRKQKWIALAARFNTLSPEERGRITARMTEWARLTPAERGQARLRFEEARQVPATDRSARWEAYQALPRERREEFAARAALAASAASSSASARSPKPFSRDSKEAKSNIVPNPALSQAPRPVAPTLVQAAPGATTTLITRRPTPPAHQQSGMPKIATTPEFVQRSTLLPRRGPQAAAIAPAITPAPTARVSPPVAVTPAGSAPAR
ncbi:MAG: DUF3106 domain-containing protein [Caldimonas sp.]